MFRFANPEYLWLLALLPLLLLWRGHEGAVACLVGVDNAWARGRE